MISFRLTNPTEILFGEGQIANLHSLLPKDARALLLYGRRQHQKEWRLRSGDQGTERP